MTEEQRQAIRETNYFPLAQKANGDPAFYLLLREDADRAIEQYFGVAVEDMDEETAAIARRAAELALYRLSHR